MTEAFLRCESAGFRLKEAEIEIRRAGILDAVAALEVQLRQCDAEKAKIRADEARLFVQFTQEQTTEQPSDRK